MKSFARLALSIAAAAAIGAVFPSTGTAATIAQYGAEAENTGNYLGSTSNLSGVTQTNASVGGSDALTDRVHARAFSATTALSPTSGDYISTNNSTLIGPAFYGGFRAVAYDVTTTGSPTASIVATSTNDTIRIRAGDVTSGTSAEFAGVILFDTPSSYLGDGSTFSITGHTADNYNTTGRFVVRSGTDYYISGDTFAYANGVVPSFTLTAGKQFYAYAPGTVMNFDQSSPGSASGPFFSNVTQVGFYFERDLFTATSATSNGRTEIRVKSFAVNAVPEPAHLGLVSLVGFAGLARRRRI